jgi:hypothetical protein
VIGYVLRFDGADGKEFRPLTLWPDSVSGRLEWRWESWPTPRPLYGLKELAERPSADVVVCEGEKATDAARRLLPDFVVITSPNGSKSADKADWSPLSGRNVVIWADADSPGYVYAQAVTKCATTAGAKSVAITPHQVVSTKVGTQQMPWRRAGRLQTPPNLSRVQSHGSQKLLTRSTDWLSAPRPTLGRRLRATFCNASQH